MKRSNTKNQLYTINAPNQFSHAQYEEYQENKVIMPSEYNFEIDPSSIFSDNNHNDQIKELRDMDHINNYLQ